VRHAWLWTGGGAANGPARRREACKRSQGFRASRHGHAGAHQDDPHSDESGAGLCRRRRRRDVHDGLDEADRRRDRRVAVARQERRRRLSLHGGRRRRRALRRAGHVGRGVGQDRLEVPNRWRGAGDVLHDPGAARLRLRPGDRLRLCRSGRRGLARHDLADQRDPDQCDAGFHGRAGRDIDAGGDRVERFPGDGRRAALSLHDGRGGNDAVALEQRRDRLERGAHGSRR
jgi:hypothetical protein